MKYLTYDTAQLIIQRTGNKVHTYNIQCTTEDGRQHSFIFEHCKSVRFEFEENGDAISTFLANQSIAETNKGIELAIINPLMGETND